MDRVGSIAPDRQEEGCGHATDSVLRQTALPFHSSYSLYNELQSRMKRKVLVGICLREKTRPKSEPISNPPLLTFGFLCKEKLFASDPDSFGLC